MTKRVVDVLESIEIEKQQREIEDIRRQKYHDDYYRFRYGEGDQMAEPPASDQTLGEN